MGSRRKPSQVDAYGRTRLSLIYPTGDTNRERRMILSCLQVHELYRLEPSLAGSLALQFASVPLCPLLNTPPALGASSVPLSWYVF